MFSPREAQKLGANCTCKDLKFIAAVPDRNKRDWKEKIARYTSTKTILVGHTEKRKYKVWSLSGAVGYLGAMGCRNNVSGGTVCAEFVNIEDKWWLPITRKDSLPRTGHNDLGHRR